MHMFLFASLLIISISQSFACECGDSLTTDSFDKSKFAGKLSRFQWYTVILGKGKVSCGAALIDDQHIVTSAHCVNGLKAKSLKVQLNDKSMKSVSSVWSDSRYDNATGAYDFAILTLSSPVDSQFKPACLQEKLPEIFPSVTQIGPQGKSSYESLLGVNLHDHSACFFPLMDTEICGLIYGLDGSGCFDGPFTSVESNNKHYLTGVTSRCGELSRAAYTVVSKYNDKIKSIAPKACWKPVK